MSRARGRRGTRGASRLAAPDLISPVLNALQEETAEGSGASRHSEEASRHTTDPTYIPEPSVDPAIAAQSSRVAGQVFVGTDEQRLISFRKHKPPAFQGSRDPKVVTTWLMGMEKIFQEEEITWALFERLFHEEYFPRDVREAKQGEFEKLVQGTMTVDAYVAKFNELVKFANYGGVLLTPEIFSAKFQRGLNEKIAKRMSNTAVRNFADLVTQC
ncbi:uncharacterized protein LOC133314336 [Gastrolobium bilobum]|uniref:uncharacterized protein LOC133314336 n=1 Tax=Gastrolobium bilobum TaxID=150636 RepID=UPI002AB0EB70|nr:uncharacterized protein LOC133314336 [Gastrolobium bilobum]